MAPLTLNVESANIVFMQAKYRKETVSSSNGMKEVFVVHLSGTIDADSVDLFRQACRGPLGGRPVLFHLGGLSYVGSTGLRPFLESLYALTKVAGSDIRFCEVRRDFRHILEATPLGRRPFLDGETSAIDSYRFEYVEPAQAPAPAPPLAEPELDQGVGDLSVEG